MIVCDEDRSKFQICSFVHRIKDLDEFLKDLKNLILVDESYVCESIYFLVNGCGRDVERYLRERIEDFPCEIVIIDEAGKANAFNYYVKYLLNRECSHTIFLDSDIRLPEKGWACGLLKDLDSDENVVVAKSQPIKTLFGFKVKNPKQGRVVDRILCGQAYAVENNFLANVVIPKGHPVDDGYLSWCFKTNNFENTENGGLGKPNILESRQYHLFKGFVNILSWCKHEIRILLGTYLNYGFLKYLYLHDSKKFKDRILELNRNYESGWNTYFNESFNEFSYEKRIPYSVSLMKFSKLAHLVFIPLYCILIFIANRKISKNQVIGYW